MLARFHIAEEVTRSPFGVQSGQNLDSGQQAVKIDAAELPSVPLEPGAPVVERGHCNRGRAREIRWLAVQVRVQPSGQ
jgi:hypothetical protein